MQRHFLAGTIFSIPEARGQCDLNHMVNPRRRRCSHHRRTDSGGNHACLRRRQPRFASPRHRGGGRWRDSRLRRDDRSRAPSGGPTSRLRMNSGVARGAAPSWQGRPCRPRCEPMEAAGVVFQGSRERSGPGRGRLGPFGARGVRGLGRGAEVRAQGVRVVPISAACGWPEPVTVAARCTPTRVVRRCSLSRVRRPGVTGPIRSALSRARSLAGSLRGVSVVATARSVPVATARSGNPGPEPATH